MNALQPPIGIDLGTTYSVVAYLDSTGRPVTIPNASGDLLTPSAVLVGENELIVGKEAVRGAVVDPDSYAECFKRDIGSSHYRRKVHELSVPPEVLSAMVLARLKADAEQRLGPLRQAVITVPAFFDESRRRATQRAGQIAGLEVLDIINEPTAAALAYGYHCGFIDLHAPEDKAARQRVVVYDLGGGTFDVTVLEIAGRESRALATDGDVRLGGKDFDHRLVQHFAQRFLDAHGVDPLSDPQDAAQLWIDAQEAKHALSERTKTTAVCYHAGIRMRIEVSRSEFEKMTADLLERTESTVSLVMRQAGLGWNEIDRVLLVGGSTRMPMVSQMLQQLTGKQPDRSQSPDEAVAHGAALYAGLLMSAGDSARKQYRLVNVNAHSLGVVGVQLHSGKRTNAILIPKNTPLPAKASRTFETARAGQRSVKIPVVEGESHRPEDCTAVGECVVRNLPEGLPKGTKVEVEYRYAANGCLAVLARVPSVRHSAHVCVQRDQEQVVESLEKWQAMLLGQWQRFSESATLLPPSTVDLKDRVDVLKRFDLLYTQIGKAALRGRLPEALARVQQSAQEAADQVQRTEQQLDTAEKQQEASTSGPAGLHRHARISQAKADVDQARVRAEFTCLVLGRECIATGFSPPGVDGQMKEIRRLRRRLQDMEEQ